jgi:eukaryotic-like serine/threonine-protein kinase
MQAIAALHHDNICPVHGIYQTADGQWFVAMDYFEGETIRQRLSHGPLDPNECLGLIAQIADGLEQAHRAGVLHGEITPDSIVVTPGGVAKILDFGLVDVVPAGIIHSRDYKAPEEIRGEKVDARADIFSFGILCYEMLSGLHPFRGPEETVTDRILHETPPRLTGFNAPLDPIIQKMLCKNPAERYADLEHMMRDIANLHAPAPVEHAATQQRRLTLALGVAIAGAVLLMVWLSFHNR